MRRLFSLFSLFLMLFWASLCSVKAQDQSHSKTYAMTTYYVGLLSRGPKWTPEVTPEIERLQGEHLAHIRKLADSGKLVLAGPFTDGGHLRGIVVFQVGSLEEAKALADTDPAVKAGRLAVEMHPWFAPKGIRIDQTPSNR